jgi:hypothetical protein
MTALKKTVAFSGSNGSSRISRISQILWAKFHRQADSFKPAVGDVREYGRAD